MKLNFLTETELQTSETDNQQQEIIFGMSEKRREVVFHNSRVYYYLSQNVDKSMTTWRCSQYFKNKCKALVRTKNANGKYINSTPHSCQPEPQRIASLQFTNKLKTTVSLNNSHGVGASGAAGASFTTGQIVASLLSEASEEMKPLLPNIQSLKRKVRRLRNTDYH